MARTLQEATQHMRGVGREEGIALASYLQRAVLRTEHLLEDIIESGTIDEMKKGSSKEGQEMLDRILELAKEAKGKSAAETTEINGRISAIVKTLEKSGKDGAKLVKGLKDSGLVDAVADRSSIGSLLRDEIKGRVEGFKDKMIRKIPMVGGILANVRKAHIAGKQAEAEALSKQGGDGGNLKEDQQQDQEQVQEQGQPLKVIQDQEQGQEQVVAVRTIQDQPLEVIQRADVAHQDAKDTNDALQTIADATSSTAESTGGIEDATTEEEYDAGEEEREGKKKSKLGKMFGGLSGLFSGRRKEGGGDSILDDIFGTTFGGLLGGGVGAMAGFLTGTLLPALAGVATAIAPVVIPLLLVAAVAAAAYTLGKIIFDKLYAGQAEKGAEAGEKGHLDATTKFSEAGELKSTEGAMYRDVDTGAITSSAKSKSGQENDAIRDVLMANTGVSKIYDQSSDAYKSMLTGDLSTEEFAVAEKQARWSKGMTRKEAEKAGKGGKSAIEGMNRKQYLELYEEVFSFDKAFREGWAEQNSRWEASDGRAWWDPAGQATEQSGEWYNFVAAKTMFAKGLRDNILRSADRGVITEDEMDMLFDATPFIGKDWEPHHNEVGAVFGMGMDPTTVGDEYNMPGWGNDLNIDDNLSELYPDSIWNSAAAKHAGQNRMHKGGLISGTRDVMATLRPNEAVVPLDDPDVLQMMQMVTANAMTKGTNNGAGGGGGGSATIIAPTTSTVSVSNDNIFATSPITRNPEKTLQRVTYG